jgi:hypothetical protein
MLMKIINPSTGDHGGTWLRSLGRLIGLTAVYQRPGMPIAHVPTLTEPARRVAGA